MVASLEVLIFNPPQIIVNSKINMAVYTKKGDRGETGLYSSSQKPIRVSKSSVRIRALGAIDELNSFLGLVAAFSSKKSLNKTLDEIQTNLFTINSIIAGAKLKFDIKNTKKLERQIDEMEGKLPVLSNFILPGGTKTGSMIHFARTLVRRAERELVELNNSKKIPNEILMYMNRLSDFLFMLARETNYNGKSSEKIWKIK